MSHYKEALKTADNYDIGFSIVYALDHLKLAAEKIKDKELNKIVLDLEDFAGKYDEANRETLKEK